MISVIVITKNEAEMIADCLASVQGVAGEILVVDTGNTDATNQIARKSGARIIPSGGPDYSRYRNDGLKAARGDWILFVDADERLTPELKSEILRITAANQPGVYALPRRNIYLGRVMSHGGWGGDRVIRFFHRSLVTGFTGALHEQPVFTAKLQSLTSPLLHYSHRDLSSMLDKTLQFTEIEARLRFDAGHPPVVWWRFFRVMWSEFWYRFVRLSAWKDGPEGLIDGMFQVFNTFIIYARLWEFQYEAKTGRRLRSLL